MRSYVNLQSGVDCLDVITQKCLEKLKIWKSAWPSI